MFEDIQKQLEEGLQNAMKEAEQKIHHLPNDQKKEANEMFLNVSKMMENKNMSELQKMQKEISDRISVQKSSNHL